MILFYSILTFVGDDHDFFFMRLFFFFYELFTIFYLFYLFHLLHSRHITTPPRLFPIPTNLSLDLLFLIPSFALYPYTANHGSNFGIILDYMLLLLFYRLRLDMRIITTTWTSIERTNKPPIVHDIKWNVAYTLAAC